MKPIPVVIVSYNTLPYLRRCLESILVHSHFEESLPYRLIVIDNGSEDGTQKYLWRLNRGIEDATQRLDVVENERNLGWVKGVNQGTEMALALDPDYIILSNSDIAIPGDRVWLEKYVDLLQAEEVGAVGPVSNFVMGLQKYEFNPQLPPVHEAKFLIGFFMAAKAEVVKKVSELNFGKFLDERFGMGGNDDLDLSIRIRRLGYKLLINRRAFVFHYGSKTLLPFFKGWEGIAEQEAHTRALLVEKWGQDVVNELFTMPEGVQGRLGGAGQGI